MQVWDILRDIQKLIQSLLQVQLMVLLQAISPIERLHIHEEITETKIILNRIQKQILFGVLLLATIIPRQV